MGRKRDVPLELRAELEKDLEIPEQKLLLLVRLPQLSWKPRAPLFLP